MNKKILYVFALALSLRLIFFLIQGSWNQEMVHSEILLKGTDQFTYDRLAKNMIEYHIFSYKPDLPPVIIRTPGYPIYIAIIYFLFGYLPWLVLLGQIIIDSFSAALIFMTFSRGFGQKIGLISGILYAIQPHLILYSLSMYSDSIFVALLVLSLNFLSRYFFNDRSKILNLGFSALFLGLSALVKPAVLFVPFIVAVFLLINNRSNLFKGVKYSLVYAAVYIITISPWLVRNEIIYHTPLLSNSGEYNLLVLNIVPVEMETRNNSNNYEVDDNLRAEADSLMKAEGKLPFMKKVPQDYWDSLALQHDYNKTEYWQKVAVKYIKREPVLFTKHYFLGIINTFFNIGTTVFARNLHITEKPTAVDIKSETNFIDLVKDFFLKKELGSVVIGVIILFYMLCIYSCFLIGFLRLKTLPNKSFLIMCFVVAAYFILIAGAGGLARFKMPAIPFYIIFCSFGINYIWEYLIRRRSKAG